MKLLKSNCEKAWLFDVARYKEELTAGLACFLPECKEHVHLELNGTMYCVAVPHRAINSPVPVKVSNARLSLLVTAPHE